MGKIIIKQGDITKETADAIVNAANVTLRGGGGVDGAIHRAGGKAILDECVKIGGCPTGDAVITGAGQLTKIKKVIHTVGPVWQGGEHGEARLLRRCYQRCFELARQNHLKTIAFPAISTGRFGYPIREAAKIALEEGFKVQIDFHEIRYICFSQPDFYVYETVYEEILPNEM